MIKERIKELRSSRNLTQEDVANAMKIAKSTYIKYEKGTQSPQLETIEVMAKFYGVDISEFFDEKKPDLDLQLMSKLELINQLEKDEKESIILMIEGLIFRRQNINLSKRLA
ncbi:transcriptional repressor rstR [Aliivibrio fischeri ES114]|uniref:Transcriptional repressor rstR n=1 Tax=Aliivibrio fischeri (strain ATCC 700601 / ES114) TaxID=312309 RepID=Q5DZZ4_ALIF1|nr:helix-turn-helix transcriptional regulator [Aliivibrio fischeri]AAW87652.1 transcriptional repressor rstR [Aliivibrio fischeri ES114]KLU78194.1 XRE family transcriptional regulator [Aliivibrio fischeri]